MAHYRLAGGPLVFIIPVPIYRPVVPVAYQVILEPGIRRFRAFESRRVHTGINS